MATSGAYWRVCYTVGGNTQTRYCRNYNVRDGGLLRFTDLDGNRRIIGRNVSYTITECDSLPPKARAKIEDAEVIES